MKSVARQNSFPEKPAPSARTPTSADNKRRRRSHEVATAYITRTKGTLHVVQEGKGALTNISFGYASGISSVGVRRKTSESDTMADSYSETPASSSEDQPSSSRSQQQVMESSDFFARLPDQRVVPLFCECLGGREADVFLGTLCDKNKERLKRFLEKEPREPGEYHVWLRNDDTGRVTVVSVKALENHFCGKSERVKRVKWRHVSLDKVSIYRYSVPVITTKFRLRMVHFLSRNYRCCILCVWCFVIFFISIGIVLTVVFGSTPVGRHLHHHHLNNNNNDALNASLPDNQTTALPSTADNRRLLNTAKNGGMPAHG